MSRLSVARLSPVEVALLAALAIWGIGPVLLMVVHAAVSHEQLTGTDGIIGGDQLQYMAWIRDAGSHGLASNLFEPNPTAHVFAQPMFTVSAALWAIGVPLALSYLLWKPVAIVVLLLGLARFSARVFADDRGARWATLVLSLAFFTPLAALAGWADIGSVAHRTSLLVLAGELFPAGELWGYLPSAIAIGLMPVTLLAIVRALDARTGRDAARPLALAICCGALISWLHPWQGAILELILVGLAAWGRGRRLSRVAPLFVAVGLPLVYYLALARFDPAWKLASHNELAPHFSALVLLVGLGPPAVIAAAGVRRPGEDQLERALLLWVPASLIAYFVLGSYPSHALESLGLPLAVFAVRAWRRLRLPAAAGAIAIALVTVPGMAYEARVFRDDADGPLQRYYYVNRSESRELAWIADDAPPGAVLARTLFALVIPSQTGRRVWVGHQFWSQDYAQRRELADALFAGGLRPAVSRTFVLLSGVKLVAADCTTGSKLTQILAPIASSIHRFGCATVYVVRRPAHAV